MPYPRFLIRDHGRNEWISFKKPVQFICVHKHTQVIPALENIEQRVEKEGLFAVGFVSYDAAPAFDSALQTLEKGFTPLLWFGLFKQIKRFKRLPCRTHPPVPITTWEPEISSQNYARAISRIKQHISEGNTYQVNFTYRLRAAHTGPSWPLFRQMHSQGELNYGAFLETESLAICSASPELFFERNGDTIISRPMKGTAARGRTWDEDWAQARRLHMSAKNRAENIMIVDMVRNDLGRMAEPGTVMTDHLYSLEKYPTLWQMTSTVRARTQASLVEIFRALFPAASITGAPKVRTMEIIRHLEISPRGIYTGAIGCLFPGRRSQFSVAIRTVAINKKNREAEYGVGGGIVWDSQTQSEQNECHLKTHLLTKTSPDFKLIETLLWTPEGGYFLLELHLNRLMKSSDYFSFLYDRKYIQHKLIQAGRTFPSVRQKVRILLDRTGTVQLDISPLKNSPAGVIRLALAPGPVDSGDPFLYHKTTHRLVYDRARATRPEADDVLLWNEKGEITESCRSNVIIKMKGRHLTPPVHCGLLAGTFRNWLLTQGKITERIIHREELETCEKIYLVNSVRKQQPAAFILAPSQTPS